MLSAVGLRKSFGHIQAVDGVDLQLKPGETFGLLGPNGAGKTTTIHMLVGAVRPDAGTISIEGVSDPTRPEVRRFVGLAPQVESLYDELTGQENLTFFARLYGLVGNRLRDRVAWGLELAGLTERRGDRVKGYSGGMKRRLNLACAMVHEPKVLFLDEPTAGVDPQSRSHLLANIEELAKSGRIIVYTTHYMEEAQRLCDRVAIMDHGKILALDSVPGLLAQHGGLATVEAELAQPAPAGVGLPGTCDGAHLRFHSHDAFEEAARLRGQGVQFASLHIERPNLETVFLTLTGRRLRD